MTFTDRREWVRELAGKATLGVPLTASQIDEAVPSGGAIAVGRTISPLFRKLPERTEADGTRVRELAVVGFKITRLERDVPGVSGQLHRTYIVETAP